MFPKYQDLNISGFKKFSTNAESLRSWLPTRNIYDGVMLHKSAAACSGCACVCAYLCESAYVGVSKYVMSCLGSG